VDTRLRELERQWRATGSWEDEEAFALARAREQGLPLLRTDGLYRAFADGCDRWLRFFGDGSVAGTQFLRIDPILEDEPGELPGLGWADFEEVETWLRLGGADGGRGEVAIVGVRVAFELRTYRGEFFEHLELEASEVFTPEAHYEFDVETYEGRVRESGCLELSCSTAWASARELVYAFELSPGEGG